MLLIVCRLIVITWFTIAYMEITQIFAQNVRRLRKEQGLSQEALADRAGLHRTYVGAVERGERNITLVSANRIARALGLELSELLKDS
jgi:transcriptional regulator with XRE-family HTH domain